MGKSCWMASLAMQQPFPIQILLIGWVDHMTGPGFHSYFFLFFLNLILVISV